MSLGDSFVSRRRKRRIERCKGQRETEKGKNGTEIADNKRDSSWSCRVPLKGDAEELGKFQVGDNSVRMLSPISGVSAAPRRRSQIKSPSVLQRRERARLRARTESKISDEHARQRNFDHRARAWRIGCREREREKESQAKMKRRRPRSSRSKLEKHSRNVYSSRGFRKLRRAYESIGDRNGRAAEGEGRIP